MLRLAILVSGGGTNLQAILDASSNGSLGDALPSLVVSDRPCVALNRAKKAGVPVKQLSRAGLGKGLCEALGNLLVERKIDMIALAGWLSILNREFVQTWEGRIVNIHPSLLPRHGGPGMYGKRVHQSVLDSGDAFSGCTVHLVSEGVDEGEILACSRVPVLPGDSPLSLAERILVEEHRLYPRVIAELSESLTQI